MERARADLSNAYNYFSVTQLGAEIFEFKDDPVPKFFVKSNENRIKPFLQLGITAFKIVIMTKARIIM